MDQEKILVTGGAGFIGSHLVDKLIENKKHVIVIDNLSQGKIKNIQKHIGLENFEFHNEDISSKNNLKYLENVNTVYHLAAYPEVRTGFDNPSLAFEENILKTFQLLEMIRVSNVEKIIFTSSSVVYGDSSIIPTPENFGPLKPISIYGGSKLACEGIISSYCNTYGIKGIIFRFANVIGSRSEHGVIWDFIHKIKENNEKLQVLGDGKQTKSYIHVNDCIEGLLISGNKTSENIQIFNLSNEDWIDVISIAKIVCKLMNVDDSIIELSGGTKDGRGWVGDVKKMRLGIDKIKSEGWDLSLNSEKAVKKACSEIISNLKIKKN